MVSKSRPVRRLINVYEPGEDPETYRAGIQDNHEGYSETEIHRIVSEGRLSEIFPYGVPELDLPPPTLAQWDDVVAQRDKLDEQEYPEGHKPPDLKVSRGNLANRSIPIPTFYPGNL